MSGHSTYQPQNAFMKWMESRLPIGGLVHSSFVAYPTPRNLNYWWTFGGILTFMLGVQIVTGIVLAMHYVPTEQGAFDSIEKIMRDVNWGWLLRYTHAVGASMFFLAVYIHTFRGLYYGSYKAPREVLWILGVLILLLMIATAFMGYSLPWGQMSFWAVTVITNLFSSLDAVIPGLGTRLVQWIWGGFAVGDPTLNRLYALHYLFPFIIAGVVVLHIWALHIPGNNNPTGIEVKTVRDVVPFHPYYTIKDGFALVVFVLLFAAMVFYAPNLLGHPDNYIPANPLQTPPHIVPEWYFLPFYAILRAIPNKLLGVIALASSISILFFVPWLDTSKVRSTRYRPIYKWFFWAFVVTCLVLGYLGSQPPEGWYLILGRIFTFYYFAFFLLVMPIVGLIERPRRLPGSITEPVLGAEAAKPRANEAAPKRQAEEVA
jgi:quinol-cytochrome oxidoreductase complex cytochrome b subunit